MDEIDMEKSVPDCAAKVVQHFTSPAAELERMEEKPEELAAELHALRERLKADKAREERIVAYFKAQKARGDFQLGGCVMSVDDNAGKASPDWEAIAEELGYTVDVAKAKLSKIGKPFVTVSVKKLGGAK